MLLFGMVRGALCVKDAGYSLCRVRAVRCLQVLFTKVVGEENTLHGHVVGCGVGDRSRRWAFVRFFSLSPFL